jgi:hypothetical protein
MATKDQQSFVDYYGTRAVRTLPDPRAARWKPSGAGPA